jgi:tetratricopeptide (TPR) repeat protein
MPKRDVTGLPHSALTNHRIRTSNSQGHTEPSQELSVDIIHFNRPPGEARKDLSPLTLLKAYGELMYREPRFRQRYLVLLKQLENSSPNDSFVQVALGRIALRESEPDSNARAIERLSKGIELGSTLSAAYQDLAEALSRAGRTQDAVGILRRGIALEPYAPVLYKVLVQQYIKLRWYSQAKQTAKTYIDIFPQDSFMRALPDQIPAP